MADANVTPQLFNCFKWQSERAELWEERAEIKLEHTFKPAFSLQNQVIVIKRSDNKARVHALTVCCVITPSR